MKNKYSLLACCLISLTMLFVRFSYLDSGKQLPVKVTTWDALGYYLYLPSAFIYHDMSGLDWFPAIDSTYSLSGGTFYQASRLASGKHVFKFLGGVAIMQLPFFLFAHLYASHSSFPADGFSAPYQYAIAWGCLCWFLIALFLLRTILLRYYSDVVAAFTLVLLILASNSIQYIAIEAGQSHGYIFPLYVLILYASIKWHESPGAWRSFFIGFLIVLASISRPTEAIMLFIPLLWQVHSRKDFKEKIKLLQQRPKLVLMAIVGGLIGLLPQVIYWYHATGQLIYDVGSKWDFLNPHFRVLFGWEKGWFIYTPVTILFVLGLFFMKNKPFRSAVMVFCLLNIYIIISWHIWRYGGSYSTRALVQSYPVFALALAAMIERMFQAKWAILIFSPVALYLIIVNLFQIKQYNEGILHYDEMNRSYYAGIYLNPRPSALTMSLLDTKEFPEREDKYRRERILNDIDSINAASMGLLFEKNLSFRDQQASWYKISAIVHTESGLWGSYLTATFAPDTLATRVRLFHPLAKEGKDNVYTFFARKDNSVPHDRLMIKLEPGPNFMGNVKQINVEAYYDK